MPCSSGIKGEGKEFVFLSLDHLSASILIFAMRMGKTFALSGYIPDRVGRSITPEGESKKALPSPAMPDEQGVC
jgi:hypothetical protein